MIRQISIRKEFEGTDNSYNLDWSKKSLSSLQNLSSFSHVLHLNLSDNRLSDISPLSDCRELEYLNVSNNCLREISNLDRLLNLRILNLQGNEIKRIENLHNLLKLEILDLSSNSISKIENLSDNLGLKCLLLGTNFIREIEGLFHLDQLMTLDVKSNQIMTLKDVRDHLSTSVQTLNLENNKIRSIFDPFYLRVLPNIRNLVVQRNPFVLVCEEKKINFRAVTLFLSGLLLDSLDYGEVSDEDITMVNDLKRRRVLELDSSKGRPSDSYLIDIFKLEAPENAYRVQIAVPQQRGRLPLPNLPRLPESVGNLFPNQSQKIQFAGFGQTTMASGFGESARTVHRSSSKGTMGIDRRVLQPPNVLQANAGLSDSEVFVSPSKNQYPPLQRNVSGGIRVIYSGDAQQNQRRARNFSPTLSGQGGAFGEIDQLREELQTLRRQVSLQRNSKRKKARNEDSEEDRGRDDQMEEDEGESSMEKQVQKMKRHHKRATRRNPRIFALTQSYDKKLLDRIRRYYEKLLEIQVSSFRASKQQQSGNKELIKLQAWFRGHIIRDKLLLNQFSNRSATLIQAVWRGHYVRKALSTVRPIEPKRKRRNEDESKSHLSGTGGSGTIKAISSKIKEMEGRIDNLENVLRSLITHFGETQGRMEQFVKEQIKEELGKMEKLEKPPEEKPKSQEEPLKEEKPKKKQGKEIEVQTVPERVTSGTNTDELELLNELNKKGKTVKKQEEDEWVDEEEETQSLPKQNEKEKMKQPKEKNTVKEKQEEAKEEKKKNGKVAKKTEATAKKTEETGKKQEETGKKQEETGKESKKKKKRKDGMKKTKKIRTSEEEGDSSENESSSESSESAKARKKQKSKKKKETKSKELKYAQKWAKDYDKKRKRRARSSSDSEGSESSDYSEAELSELEELKRRKREYQRRQKQGKENKRKKQRRGHQDTSSEDYEGEESDYEREMRDYERENGRNSRKYGRGASESGREKEQTRGKRREVGYRERFEVQRRMTPSRPKKQVGNSQDLRQSSVSSKNDENGPEKRAGYSSSGFRMAGSGSKKRVYSGYGSSQRRETSNDSSRVHDKTKNPITGPRPPNSSSRSVYQNLPNVLNKTSERLRSDQIPSRPLKKAELQPGAVMRNSQLSQVSSSSSMNQSIGKAGVPSWIEAAKTKGENQKRRKSVEEGKRGEMSKEEFIKEMKESRIKEKKGKTEGKEDGKEKREKGKEDAKKQQKPKELKKEANGPKGKSEETKTKGKNKENDQNDKEQKERPNKGKKEKSVDDPKGKEEKEEEKIEKSEDEEDEENIPEEKGERNEKTSKKKESNEAIEGDEEGSQKEEENEENKDQENVEENEEHRNDGESDEKSEKEDLARDEEENGDSNVEKEGGEKQEIEEKNEGNESEEEEEEEEEEKKKESEEENEEEEKGNDDEGNEQEDEEEEEVGNDGEGNEQEDEEEEEVGNDDEGNEQEDEEEEEVGNDDESKEISQKDEEEQSEKEKSEEDDDEKQEKEEEITKKDSKLLESGNEGEGQNEESEESEEKKENEEILEEKEESDEENKKEGSEEENEESKGEKQESGEENEEKSRDSSPSPEPRKIIDEKKPNLAKNSSVPPQASSSSKINLTKANSNAQGAQPEPITQGKSTTPGKETKITNSLANPPAKTNPKDSGTTDRQPIHPKQPISSGQARPASNVPGLFSHPETTNKNKTGQNAPAATRPLSGLNQHKITTAATPAKPAVSVLGNLGKKPMAVTGIKSGLGSGAKPAQKSTNSGSFGLKTGIKK